MTKNPDAATQAFEWLPLNEALAKYPKGHPYWDSVVNPGNKNDYENAQLARDADIAPPIWATWGKMDTQQRDPEQRIRALCDFFQNFEASGLRPSAEFMAMFAKPLTELVSAYDILASEREKLDRLEDSLPQAKSEFEQAGRTAKITERATATSDSARQKAREDYERKSQKLMDIRARIERGKKRIKEGVKYASLDKLLEVVAPSDTKGMRPPKKEQIAAIAHAADIAPKGTKESSRNAAAKKLGYRHRPATLPSTISNYKSKIRHWKEENGELIPPPMLPLEVATEVAESANRRAEEKKRALRDWAENPKNDEG